MTTRGEEPWLLPYTFAPPNPVSVNVVGSAHRFPVHRIYCVGRNYAAHAREMGKDPEREAPFFFSKPADAVVHNGTPIVYPPKTANLHHEVELVVALGNGGVDIPTETAKACIFGYAVGNDLTRRDLQLEARDKGRPWEVGKSFDRSAVVSAISPVEQRGYIDAGRIWLKVNDQLRQDGDIRDLIWTVPEIIATLSSFFELAAGDLIYTGTPAGVGALTAGDRVEASIDGLDVLRSNIVAPSDRQRS